MASFMYILLMIVIMMGVVSWHFSRSSDIVQDWAISNGYRVIDKKYAFFKGPFFWTSSKEQTVYRVVVEDQTGQRRSGWVRCGSW